LIQIRLKPYPSFIDFFDRFLPDESSEGFLGQLRQILADQDLQVVLELVELRVPEVGKISIYNLFSRAHL
jgi:hypothetical protein